MSLVEKLYPEDETYLNKIWGKFPLLNPDCQYLGYKFVSYAIESRDTPFFVNQVRNSFYPYKGAEDNTEVQEQYRLSINLGIAAINWLCKHYLPLPHPRSFLIEEVAHPLDLFNFIKNAREEWIEARKGKHESNPELMFSAYNKVRAHAIGSAVKVLESSPEVVSSMRYYPCIREWFKKKLGFECPKKVSLEGVSYSWDTLAGVKVYGSEDNAMRHRLKIFDPRTFKIKYDSLLMKMWMKGVFPTQIMDHIGVEFLVESYEDADKLTRYFQKSFKISGIMEEFKKRERGKKKKDNEMSSSDFDVIKFILRPPICAPPLPAEYKTGNECCERIPVEVQIITLEDDKIRREHPDVRHEAYKESQFMRIFPAVFPRQIYKPLIKL